MGLAPEFVRSASREGYTACIERCAAGSVGGRFARKAIIALNVTSDLSLIHHPVHFDQHDTIAIFTNCDE